MTLIDKDALLEKLSTFHPDYTFNITSFRNFIKAQPEVEKKGKWNWDFADNGWADWTCSICGWEKNTDIHVNLGYNFCPNCGADMRERKEE